MVVLVFSFQESEDIPLEHVLQAVMDSAKQHLKDIDDLKGFVGINVVADQVLALFGSETN